MSSLGQLGFNHRVHSGPQRLSWGQNSKELIEAHSEIKGFAGAQKSSLRLTGTQNILLKRIWH